RESLRTGLTEKDILPVTRCLLMNYSSLTDEEKNTLWKIISERISYSREFASMVLRYYSIMDKDIREGFLVDVLESDNHQGRDALGQLICLGREDLVESSLQLVETIVSEEPFEKRAGLPFFLLWNRNDLGDPVKDLLRRLASDPSPYVRRSLVRALRALGLREEPWIGLLEELSADVKRAVRASVATTLGEIETGGEKGFNEYLNKLLEDEDSYVRLSAISGLLHNVYISSSELLPVLLRAFADQASEVRLEAIRGLRGRPDLQDIPEVDKALAERFADSDRSVRMEVVKLVTDTPGLLGSDIIRNRMPDILLNRLTTGHAISEELNMARKIQMDLLPDDPPSPDRCDIEIFYRPAREVGGDYYDFFDLPDRNLGMAVADVAGKGIPAALTMAGLKGNLEAYVQSIYSISDIVHKVNESSILGEGDPIITGLFYGVLDLASGVLTYVNAGHNPPFLIKRGGEVKWLDKGGLVLGLVPEAVYEHDSAKMDPGDVLVLYTDGLTEAMDSSENEFGARRLMEVVSRDRDLSASQISGAILEAVNSHSGGSPQGDDQTLVVVKYK
ncbi:MAG: SpoIIE family protein phosphatase, partial [Candidatus Aegiribacteria sp.]|nr:SpoIIE family protein phosphatase [Candidatus Aegiribacteria sp.]MBD3294955.1 SpoIIE family protein phosphatase [Candidatus Fermentibacteria bacterium]